MDLAPHRMLQYRLRSVTFPPFCCRTLSDEVSSQNKQVVSLAATSESPSKSLQASQSAAQTAERPKNNGNQFCNIQISRPPWRHSDARAPRVARDQPGRLFWNLAAGNAYPSGCAGWLPPGARDFAKF